MKTPRLFAYCILALAVNWICAAADVKTETQPRPSPAEPKLTIVNIASHCDWSWAHTRAWHENRYADMIRDYLMLMRTNPKLVWQFETVNEQLRPFLAKAQRQWPGLIDEFWRRVKEGRIEVVNAYSNPRLSEVYSELFVRSLVLASSISAGTSPALAKTCSRCPI